MPIPEEIVTYYRSLVVIAARHIEDAENDKDEVTMELRTGTLLCPNLSLIQGSRGYNCKKRYKQQR